jgi:DNA repair protein RadC
MINSIREMQYYDTPAYRLDDNSRQCNVIELLAAIIGGDKQLGIASDLYQMINGDVSTISSMKTSEIEDISGIGASTAARLKAAIELAFRINKDLPKLQTVMCPTDAFTLCSDMQSLDQEYLKVILLDTRNNVRGIEEIYHGSVNSSQVRVAEVFKPAIKNNCPVIIIVHNHPSGDPTPSPDDVAVTRAIVSAGKLLDIEVYDHIVVGKNNKFVSLKERGLGFQ